MRFELFIAARYLRAKRRQAVVGVITLISVIGVAAGVASLIIALAITNGMRRDLQEKLLGSTAHVDADAGCGRWDAELAASAGAAADAAACDGGGSGVLWGGADLAGGAEWRVG